MATKKKPAPKKPARPASGVAKPVKKAPVKKAAPKKTVKPAAKKAAPRPAAKKAAPAPKKAAKPVAVKKPVAKPAAKPAPVVAVKKTEPKKETPAPVPVVVEKAATPKLPAKPVFKPVTNTPPPQPKKQAAPAKPAKLVIPKTTTTRAVKYEPDFTKSVLDTTLQEQTGPTMRYSDADLAEFRELINKKLDAAKKELAYLQGLITRKDESGDMEDARYMTMEDGGISMEREQLSQMASRQITFIDHLEKAIMRIENKTYGICRVTGKLIDKARLKAVPHATLSIEAKQMMNK